MAPAVLEVEPRNDGQPPVGSYQSRTLASPYLFHHDSSERVGDEDERTVDLLRQYELFSHSALHYMQYLRFSSLVHQADQQAFGMIDDLCHRPSKRRVGIIAECHNTSIRNLLGREIPQLELLRFRVCLGGEGIASEAMNSHDTIQGLR